MYESTPSTSPTKKGVASGVSMARLAALRSRLRAFSRPLSNPAVTIPVSGDGKPFSEIPGKRLEN